MKTQEKNYKNQIAEDKTELIANNNFWKGEQQRVGDENKIKKVWQTNPRRKFRMR